MFLCVSKFVPLINQKIFDEDFVKTTNRKLYFSAPNKDILLKTLSIGRVLIRGEFQF